MRRRLATLLAIGLALPAGRAAAQAGRVSVSVDLAPTVLPGGARAPRLQLHNLLADPRWSEALARSFSIRLSFRLEIWRSRDGWIDELERGTEWTTVIQHEPLQDQYRVTQILKSGVEESRFPTRDDLDRELRRPFDVDAVPRGEGLFYYTVKLKITALSDEDMEELERFLAGDTSGPAPTERSSIGRGLRKLLLRMAGLPGEELEVRSEKFRVTR
jgi:hypothetical protein